jgi:hypothetical protein
MEDKNKELASFDVGGVFTFQQIRDGKVIDEWEEKNLVVNEGLNHLLDATLHGATQEASWFIGIFEGNYTPVTTDNASNIAINATESTAYTETTRPAWTEAAAAGQSITNSANKATFTINATKTIYGAFLISDSTKSGTVGKLFAASKFSVSRSVVTDDQLLVTYTVSAATS